MAITTEDGIISGMKPPVSFHKAASTGEGAGRMHNLAHVTGNPGAWTFGAPGLAGVAISTSGQIGGNLNFENPTSANAYLAKLSVSVGANIIGYLLYDLLWYNTGLAETTTTAQTINSVTWPARDADGSTNGKGVEIWLTTTTATTNAGAISNTTYSYTNSEGTASRSAGLVYPWPATAVAGTAVPFALQGSDVGVRSVQSITLGTSYGGGQVDAIALRRIAYIPMVGATSGALVDWAGLGFPRLYNNSSLYMMVLLSGTAAGSVQGDVAYSHG